MEPPLILDATRDSCLHLVVSNSDSNRGGNLSESDYHRGAERAGVHKQPLKRYERSMFVLTGVTVVGACVAIVVWR